MTKVIERVEAHYEVQDVEMGKVYRWRPANVLVECTCGEEPTLSAFRTTCGECGADHVAFVGDLLDARPEVKGDHPWRYLPGATSLALPIALHAHAGRYEGAGAVGLWR